MTREELKTLIQNEVKDVEGRLTDADFEDSIDKALDYIRQDLILKKQIILDYAQSIVLTTLPDWTEGYSMVLALGVVVNKKLLSLSGQNDYSIIGNTLYCFVPADKIVIEYKILPRLENLDDYKIDLVFLGTAFCFLKLSNSYVQASSPVVDAQVNYGTKRDDYLKQAEYYFGLYEARKKEAMNRRDKSQFRLVNIDLPKQTFFH